MQSNSNNRTFKDHVNDLTGNNRNTGAGMSGTGNAPNASTGLKGSYPQSSLPGPAPNTAGPHNKDILNKIDPTVDALSGGTQVLGPGINPGGQGSKPTQTHGQNVPASAGGHAHTSNQYQPQHNSRMANELDPTVDSSHTGHATGAGATSGRHGMTGASGQPMTDNSYARGGGEYGAHNTHGREGAGAVTGDTYGSEGGQGPHRSKLANAMDPRVDSNTGAGTQGYGGSGQSNVHQGATQHHHQTHGANNPYANEGGGYAAGGNGLHRQEEFGGNGVSRKPVHSSGVANALDPRVDTSQGEGNYTANQPTGGNGFGAEHRGNTHGAKTGNTLGTATGNTGAHYGEPGHAGRARGPAQSQSTTVHHGPEILPGPASTTAGPHKSNWMNKLDPTVDSKAGVTEQREYRTS